MVQSACKSRVTVYKPQVSEPEDITPKLLETLYERLRKLGEGARGSVYVAREIATGREVAFKETKLEEASFATENKSMRAAWRAIGGVVHPNIATIERLFWVEKTYMFVAIMELVSGEDLDSVLKDEERAISLFWPVAQGLSTALEFLHTNKVAHNDIKLGNVMISDGVIKVVDMDFSCREKDCLHNEAVGTPEFLSPELARAIRYNRYLDVDERMASDVWACGVVLYVLCNYEYPYPLFKNIDDTLLHISKFPPKESVYGTHRKIISMGMESSVANRASAGEMRVEACGGKYTARERDLYNNLFNISSGDTASFFWTKYEPEPSHILEFTHHLVVAISEMRHGRRTSRDLYIGMHPEGTPGHMRPGAPATIWLPDPLAANDPVSILRRGTNDPLVYILNQFQADMFNTIFQIDNCRFTGNEYECKSLGDTGCTLPVGGVTYNCDEFLHKIFPHLRADATPSS